MGKLAQGDIIMSTEFASACLTAGQLNAIVKKLGGHYMALRFLRDELLVSEPTRSWREEDGVIYFSVTSDGKTGEDWINHLEVSGFFIGDYAKQVLLSPSFKPTNGVKTEVAVLKGMLFEYNDRVTENIHNVANKHKLGKPEPELACLIREKFTDKDIEAMGLVWIVAMHEPINDSNGNPSLLSAHRHGDGRWVSACNDNSGDKWNHRNGFAFVLSSL